MQPVDYLPHVEQLCRQAAAAILAIYHGGEFDTTAKGDDSPLTAADLAAHHLLVDGLQALTPDIPVLSEESADVPSEQRLKWSHHWLVDPLDGTREFLKRNGEFTVNVALIEHHRPVLGVVWAPALACGYVAAEGFGAEYHGPRGYVTRLQCRIPAERPLRVVGSRSHPAPAMVDYLAQLGEHDLVPMGSSLKFCLVAKGDADLYPRLGPTSEWDTAAAQCVVEQAGGSVIGRDGQPLRYNTRPSLLNPYFVVCGDPQLSLPQLPNA